MILRCTGRLLSLLGVRRGDLSDQNPSEDDWYANLLWIERRKCLLLTHAGTFLSVFVADVRKGDLVPIGAFVALHIRRALLDESLPPDALGAIDAESAQLGRTASRSVLGCMNQDALMLEDAVVNAGGLDRCDVRRLNRDLRRTLHMPAGRGGVWPLDEARSWAGKRSRD